MKKWKDMFSLLKALHDRDMRRRSIEARNREMPKMRKILGLEVDNVQNRVT